MSAFDIAFEETKKRLKPGKVNLVLVRRAKDAAPTIWITWGRKLTPKFPDGSEHVSATFKKSLADLMKCQPLATLENLVIAERIAHNLANSIQMNTFKWEDYPFWLPDPPKGTV